MNKILSAQAVKPFKERQQTKGHGAEYWSAHDMQGMLGYSQWRRFEEAIKKAMTSCEESGNNAGYHFASVGKPITGGEFDGVIQ